MAQQNHTALKLERRKEVEDRTGLSRSAIYDKISKGEFPPPIQLSARTVAWLSSEIDRWIKARIRASRSADREVCQ